MRSWLRIPLCLALLAGSANSAAAETVVFGTAQLTTSGVFVCRAEPACTSFGTSVILGTGDSAATLRFTGLSTEVSISNHTVPLTLGTFSSSSAAATFPTRTNRHLPIVLFALTLTHTSPVLSSQTRTLFLGPGGLSDLGISSERSFFQLNPGPVPSGYGNMVYSIDIPRLPLNGSIAVTADAGVVPEPATLLLVGGGLFGIVRARTRKQNEARSSSHDSIRG